MGDVAVAVAHVADDAEYGYILEVDLEYAAELQEAYNDYPLAPEKMTITRDMLSPYQRDNFTDTHGCQKLVPNVRP